MKAETIDLSSLNSKELKAELARREKSEKALYKNMKAELETDNNHFVMDTISKFITVNAALTELKESTIVGANTLYARMFEVEGKEPKEQKSFSRLSICGNYKVTVDRQERLTFTDEAEVHIQAIRNIFRKKFEDRNKGFYSLFDSILMKGTKGDYDPKILAKARQQVKAIGDEELILEFDKLDDCQRVVGTSLYARAYQKDEKGKFKDITIQFSSL